MGATTLSRTYNARLTALLDKIRPVIQNQITTANPFYFKYKKSGNWKSVSQLGDRYRVPLMYEFAPIDTFGPNGVGQVDVTPTDGQTPAFFDWSRMASSITIGDFERAQNKGAALDLLKSKTEQAMSGLEDRFGRWLMQGKGAVDTVSCDEPRTSSVNGSTFIDPIPLFINYNGAADGQTGVGTVGQINAATETWWKNMSFTSTANSFAKFLKEIDHMVNLCSQSAGPGPDLIVGDLYAYELVSAALRDKLRFTDYEEVGFPWKAIRINGAPLVFDQFVPNVAKVYANTAGATTVAAGDNESTLYFANTKYLGVTVYSGADFTPGEFVRAPNGAGETSIIQWYGSHWVSRRDKHGVIGSIDNSIAS